MLHDARSKSLSRHVDLRKVVFISRKSFHTLIMKSVSAPDWTGCGQPWLSLTTLGDPAVIF